MKIANSSFSRRNSWYLGLGFTLLLVFMASNVHAVSYSSLAKAPLFLVTSAEPLVMLNMSNDHQLYFKAYDDWSDVDGNGVADTTYNNTIDYYGYFDSEKCYSYSGDVFVPQAVTTSKYCDAVTGDWSGNFLNWATMSRMDAVRKILYGGMRSTDTTSDTVLERAYIPTDAHSFVKYYAGSDINKLSPYSSAISLCNTTYASSGNSQDITSAPLMRVAQGNYSLWTAHERSQCRWSSESPSSNSNNQAITGISASSSFPSSSATGSITRNVRVKVCVSGLEEDNCETYPDSSHKKPIGLLQQYGADGSIKFGLMTGSYQKNKSGGVLRKNISSFAGEVNSDNGKFLFPTGSIVEILNKMRISRYNYFNGYVSTDSCDFAKYGFADGECSNWGNPQSELFYESLRYFSGKTATSDFNANDSTYISGLTTSSWSDPLDDTNYCAPANIIQFNASTNSFDGDQLTGFADFNASKTLDAFTDAVGVVEGITDPGTYFIGAITSSSSNDKSCTAKDLDELSDASGVCPEAPWLEGTYQMAGMAYFANTESIRTDLTTYSGTTADIHVNTYGVALSPAQPVLHVPVPGTVDQEVLILPACMEFRDGSTGGALVNANGRRHNGNCAIVDFKIVEPYTVQSGGTATGKFLVLWESAQHGGDYDQDMGGIIEYSIDNTEITVKTNVYAASTGGRHGFGYVISGTTQDGLHIHSGHNDFKDYDDPSAGISDCISLGSCNSGDAATSATYTIGSTTATPLETPLYYAAKWGGYYEEPNSALRPVGAAPPNGIPDQAYEWDANSDGLPDNYFYSTNPAELETSLGKVFQNISEQVASSASTAANSQKVNTGSSIFQATFSSVDWSGGLLKYNVDMATGGLTLDTAAWGTAADAGALLSNSGRTIITYNPAKTGFTDDGMAFTWAAVSALTAAQQEFLTKDPDTGVVDTHGEDRLDYLRGDASKEVKNTGGIFRNRSSLLGDIINSAPVFVGTPNLGYSDILEASVVETYSQFKTRVTVTTPRANMIYVGSNDGMLHGFDASNGSEKLAYIPYAVTPNLTKQTSPSYTHRYLVDGTPALGDAVFSDNKWHTVLAGGLNAGGQGIYALDITDPANFTQTNASGIVLWEITPATTAFGELGYTFARPAIVKNHNGNWVGIFGNGYAGASGHAVLYIVNIQTGALISSVTVDSSGDNGLSTASPVDVDSDGVIDVIYAGDLKGNMWKFIPDNASAGTWKAAWGSTPLFKTPADGTGWAQAITSRPEVGVHPNLLPGVMVYFGTGKYIETSDNVLGTDVQRFYGIWDAWDQGATSSYKDASNAFPTTLPGISVSAGNLLKQCITTGTYAQTCLNNLQTTSGESFSGGGGVNVRFISDNTITTWHWAAATGKMGWYIDLPEKGERQVSSALLRAGRIIFVTITPSEHPCSNGGTSWLMELDAADGSALNLPAFDLNGDGIFDVNDLKTTTDASGNTVTLVPGGKQGDSIWQTPSILTDASGEKEYKYSSSSKATVDITTESSGMSQGRKSWTPLK